MSLTTMTESIEHLPSPKRLLQLKVVQICAVGSLLALIALGLAWELWLAPVRPGGSWLALKLLPLCWPLAGFLKNRMYTFRWVSLLVWVYFAEGVMRAGSDRAPSCYWALGQVLLCLLLFAACAAHVRLRVGPRKRQA